MDVYVKLPRYYISVLKTLSINCDKTVSYMVARLINDFNKRPFFYFKFRPDKDFYYRFDKEDLSRLHLVLPDVLVKSTTANFPHLNSNFRLRLLLERAIERLDNDLEFYCYFQDKYIHRYENCSKKKKYFSNYYKRLNKDDLDVLLSSD